LLAKETPMPEYDPTNYPDLMTDDLTSGEVGRDAPGPDPKAWPSSNLVPDTYAGPPPSREFEVSGLAMSGIHSGHKLTGQVLAPDPTPPAGKVQASIAPPPGHTAQP